MNREKKLVPKLRFPGFEGEWVEKKMSDLVTQVVREVEKPTESYERISVRSHAKGTFHQTVEDPSTVSMDKLYIVKENDLIVNITFAWEHAIAVARAEDDGLYVSHRFPTYQTEGKSDINFLQYIVAKENFRRKLEFISPGGAGRNRVLNKKDFLKIKTNVPYALKEQAKIGAFFQQLDDSIALQQRKLSHLQAQKKGLLQKMFPKAGQALPELRFPGFEGKWEERKLGDLGKTQSGIGFPECEQGGTHGIPFFKVSDMNNDGNEHEMKKANNYVNFEQLKRKNWKPINDVPCVIFAKVGAALMLDRKRIVKNPFLIDNNTMSYIFDDTWDVNFGKTLFETIYLPRYSQIGALPSFNGSDIENIDVSIPAKEEQNKIGQHFSNIDTLITLHQRKLEHLQARKKALLQQMFV